MSLTALLLTALKWGPAVFSAGKEITEAVTGTALPDNASHSPEALTDHIENLPTAERLQIIHQVLEKKAQIQGLDTQRFLAMTDGDTEKIRATARPQIALRAMVILETFAWVLKILVVATVAEWLINAVMLAAGKDPFFNQSLWELIAAAAPIQEMIWPPLLASFWASVEIIKKYMGVRERDKAHEYELQAGKPLNSTSATIEAAGGTVARIIKAFKR